MSFTKIDGALWLKAERETEWHRSQVQGFFYDTPKGAKTSKPKHHVVRDCTLKPGEQVVWSAFGDHTSYDRLHNTASAEIKRYCTNLIARKYEALANE